MSPTKTFLKPVLRPLGLAVLFTGFFCACAESPAKTIPTAASHWAKSYGQQEDKAIKDLEKLGTLTRKKPSLAEAIFSRTDIFTSF